MLRRRDFSVVVLLLALLAATLPAASDEPAAGAAPAVAVLVHGDAAKAVAPALARYMEAVRGRVPVRFLLHSGEWGSPAEVRALLRGLHAKERIEGAILVGAIPYARHRPIAPSKYEFVLAAYYEDLDLEWTDEGGDGCMDKRGTEGLGPEIWTAWIRSEPDNPAALADFFDRCCRFRKGLLGYPRAGIAYAQTTDSISQGWRSCLRGPLVERYGEEGVRSNGTLGDGDRPGSADELLRLLRLGGEVALLTSHGDGRMMQLDAGDEVPNEAFRGLYPGALVTFMGACGSGNFGFGERCRLLNCVAGHTNSLAAVGMASVQPLSLAPEMVRWLAEGVPLGRAYFRMLADNYTRARKVGATLVGDPFLTLDEYRSAPTGTLRGRVLTAPDTPLPGAEVELVRDGKAWGFARVEEDGRFEIAAPPGAYGVRLRANPWAEPVADRTPVKIAEGKAAEQDFRIQRGTVLTVTASGADGQPLPWGRIEVCREGAPRGPEVPFAGRVAFGGFDAGRHLVRVCFAKGRWFEKTVEADGRKPLTVEAKPAE